LYYLKCRDVKSFTKKVNVKIKELDFKGNSLHYVFMINLIKLFLQYLAITCFGGLTIIGWIQKDYNYGVGLNFALVLLYIFLYLQPIK